MPDTVSTDCPNLPDPAHFNLPPEVASYMQNYNTVILGLFRDIKTDQDMRLRLGAEGSIAYDSDGGLVARIIS